MTTVPSSLVEAFAQLEDDELLRRARSGHLTDAARAVALAELDRRGIEVVLPDGASDDARVDAMDAGGDMLTLVSLPAPTEAHILVARLQAEGIHAIAADAHLVQANPLVGIAVGGVRVLVAGEQLAQARALFEAMRRGELDVDDDPSRTAMQAPECPRCGGVHVTAKPAGVFRSLVLWNDAPRWHCPGCRHTWPNSI